MTETEQAIERLRHWIDDDDIRALLAEYDRIKAELDRLTTLRPASEHDGKTPVLIWSYGKAICILDRTLSCNMWTPLPTPKEAPCETA